MVKQNCKMDSKTRARFGTLALLGVWLSGILVGLSFKFEPKQPQVVIPGTYFNHKSSTDAIMAIGLNVLVDNVYTAEELSDILSSVDS